MPPVTPQQPSNAQPVPPTGGSPAGFGGGLDAFKQAAPPVQPNVPAAGGKIPWIIAGVIGFIALVLAGVSFYFYSQLTAAKKANASQFESGRSKGQEEQKQQDASDALRASLDDTRNYVAPKELGEFTFSLPKTFSMSSTTSTTGTNPLVLLANPDRVETTSKFQALRVTVKNSLFTKEKDTYDRLAKDKKTAISEAENLKVNNWNAVRYTGKFDGRDKLGTVVLVEVRDKTYVFQTDNNEAQDLLESYNRTLNSIRIQ